MKIRNIWKLLLSSLLSTLAVLSATAPVHADDIEIYTAALNGGFSEKIRPNILYIIDTSGSMSSYFFIDPEEWYEAPYDPNVTYPGNCDAQYVYRRDAASYATQQFNEYGYPVDSNGNVILQNCNTTESRFRKSTMACDANGAFRNSGWAHVRAAEFRPKGVNLNGKSMNGTWERLDKALAEETSHEGRTIWRECDLDNGIHGRFTGSSEKYPTNFVSGNSTTADGFTALQPTRNPVADENAYYILADGNFLNWFHAAPKTRIAAVQIALRDVIRQLPPDVNVGLMRFDSTAGDSSTDGGMMIKEFGRVGFGNQKQELVNALMAIPQNLDAGTPLGETLLEAFYVFGGQRTYWGAVSETDDGSAFRSVDASQDPERPGFYRSPITETCQHNSIVYFTDGAATSDGDAWDGDSTVNNAVGDGFKGGMKYFSDLGYPDATPYLQDTDSDTSTGECGASGSNRCLPILANYMAHEDVALHVPGAQTVTTHTIGFSPVGSTSNDPPDPAFLALTAELGNGRSVMVTNTEELRNAFKITTREAIIADTAFTAPALAVNAFNRVRDENRVYFAMFKTSTSPGWGGNLKAYEFGPGENGDVIIKDAAGNPAVHPDSGQFEVFARSFWSASSDGNDVPSGGAASRLPSQRHIYTWFGDSTQKTLKIQEHTFEAANWRITGEMLGLEADDGIERETVINWLRGEDVFDDNENGMTNDPRLHIGDPLHSRPIVVTYGTEQENPDQRIFMTTNDGFLHSVDAATGQEKFAFIADETLQNAKRLFVNDAESDGKVYGLDGAPVLRIDEGAEREPGISEDDKVYLYTGMRRGGRSYYAFDLTDPDDPKILWRVQGGDVNADGQPDDDFFYLGYTFSTPRTGQVKIDGQVRNILIFAGGYDLGQDSPDGAGSTHDIYREDDYGNAIFIVDALTGQRLWWASKPGRNADLGLPGMVNSIPSDVALVDSDNDGWSDRIYVGDTGGRLFRIDIDEFNENGAIQSAGGMIADLGASGVVDNPDTGTNESVHANRKFFYAPDVSLVENGANDYLAIAIGSGNRAHPSYPIDGETETDDAFFVIKDQHILGRPADYDYGIVFNDTNLFDAGGNELLSEDAAVRQAAEAKLANSKGWYLRMAHEGEKVLAESSTFNYTVVFSSFEPLDVDLQTCQARTGIGRLYALNLRNGLPVFANFDGDDALSPEDRSYELARDGIPPAPTIVFPEANDGDALLMAGPEIIPADLGSNLRRSYWLLPETSTH